MSIFTNLFLSLAVFLNGIILQIPMADTFRSDGKIYVLVAVVLIILLGFFYYLFRVDKKIQKLEDDFKNK
ncbi:MAG: hypothetical protein RIC53_16410 [Cyclobacteriaceae bacterium]